MPVFFTLICLFRIWLIVPVQMWVLLDLLCIHYVHATHMALLSIMECQQWINFAIYVLQLWCCLQDLGPSGRHVTMNSALDHVLGFFLLFKGLINELDDGNSPFCMNLGLFAAQNLLHGFSFCRVRVICLVWDVCES